MNSTYEFTLNEGPKVKIENFIGTKSWRKILEGLKRKVSIFIGSKIRFNPKIYWRIWKIKEDTNLMGLDQNPR